MDIFNPPGRGGISRGSQKRYFYTECNKGSLELKIDQRSDCLFTISNSALRKKKKTTQTNSFGCWVIKRKNLRVYERKCDYRIARNDHSLLIVTPSSKKGKQSSIAISAHIWPFPLCISCLSQEFCFNLSESLAYNHLLSKLV